MSNRELAKKLIDEIPEGKLVFIIPMLRGAAIPEVETVKPDETDLSMIKEAERENDGTAVDFDTLAKELGVQL